MIYLKQKNIIFIKTRKTAGTSVEIALSVNASDSDIVTRISPKDELVRIDAGGHFPVNWAKKPILEKRYRKSIYRAHENRELLRNVRRKAFSKRTRIKHHALPDEIKKLIGAEQFDSAHKFTIVRHPYEQIVSSANFRMRNRSERNIVEEVDYILFGESKYEPNSSFYFVDGEMVIDTFIRYEHLEDDLRQFESRFDLVILKHLPFTKHEYRQDRTPAADILTKEQKAHCYELCAWEFERFDYER